MHLSTRKPRPWCRQGFAIAAAFLAAVIACGNARAQKPSDTPLPSCEDRSLADELAERLHPRGVQKRVFRKDQHVQVGLRGGLLAADLLSSSYVVGGNLAYFFTEDLALEASFDVTPVALDMDEPLAEFFGDRRFEPETGYLALAGLLWSPVHAKLKIGDSIVHSDLMLAVGAGKLFHDSVQGVTFDAGLILDMFTSRWFTVRFDVRNIMAVQEAVAETRLTNNLIATAGVALWIPTAR